MGWTGDQSLPDPARPYKTLPPGPEKYSEGLDLQVFRELGSGRPYLADRCSKVFEEVPLNADGHDGEHHEGAHTSQ